MPSSAPLRPDSTRARYETLLEVAESIVAHRQLSTLICRSQPPAQTPGALRLHQPHADRPQRARGPPARAGDRSSRWWASRRRARLTIRLPPSPRSRSRRPYYIPDIAAETRFPIIRELLRANGIQSACILPLFTAQREIGGLHFGSLATNAYSAEDIEFMGQVARQVAVAVDNALNSEAAVAYEGQLAHERDRLRTLLEVNNAVVGCLATRELFHAISASLRRTFGLDYASLLIYDADAGALRMHDARFSRRNGRDPRGCRGAAGWQPGGLRLPHQAGPGVQPGRGARGLGLHRRPVRTRGNAIAVLRAADFARHGPRHPQCRLAPAGSLPGRRSGILHPGGRPGGHRAGQRALLQAHRRAE